MNKITLLLSCGIALTTAAYGQVWVSSTGSDANNCSRIQPCRTFQHGHDVLAAWGQVTAVDAGDYGSINITKAITIDGAGVASNVTGSGTSILVNAPAGAVVQLRNLSLHGNGASTGIQYNSGSQLVVENVKVNGFSSNCLYYSPSGSNTADFLIKDSSIDNCSSVGIAVEPSSSSTIITGAIVNTHVHYANFGLLVTVGTVSVTGSTFSSPGAGSPGVGIDVQGIGYGTPFVLVDNTLVSEFTLGVQSYVSTVQLSRTSIMSNHTGISATLGAIISNGTNIFANNYINGTPTSTIAVF